MPYEVFIEVGKGKNRATMGSIPLKSKQAVTNYVRRNPLGNYKTPVKVTNTRTNKTITKSKIYFYRKWK